MAFLRQPWPTGYHRTAEDLNDGTLIRALSPRAGSIGSMPAAGHRVASQVTIPAAATPATEASIPVLRQASRGAEVRKLQRQLNVRLAPTPDLAVDGIFGPVTLQAVLQYQKGVSIGADGIVGKQTWYHLLKGDTARFVRPPPRTPMAAASGPGQAPTNPIATPIQRAATQATSAPGVWEWSLHDKFAEALRRTAAKLPASMWQAFTALLSPDSLDTMAKTLVVWAGSQAFGVGEVFDGAMLIAGVVYLGRAVIDVAQELSDFLVLTSTALDDKDLDAAASHLAKAIAILGVAAFIALLAKIVSARGGKGAAAEEASTTTPTRTSSPSSSGRATSAQAEPLADGPGAASKSSPEPKLDDMPATASAAKGGMDAPTEPTANAADSTRGLSKSGGIFSSTTNEAGGTIWTSDGPISQNDFGQIVNSEVMQGRNVNIITGVHGNVDGTIASVDSEMHGFDVDTFGEVPGVTVHNFTDLTPDQLKGLLNGPDTVIGGFCSSGACLAPFR